MSAQNGAPSPRTAAFSGRSALPTIGPTAEKNHMAAESAVRLTSSVETPPMTATSHCPNGVSTTIRTASAR